MVCFIDNNAIWMKNNFLFDIFEAGLSGNYARIYKCVPMYNLFADFSQKLFESLKIMLLASSFDYNIKDEICVKIVTFCFPGINSASFIQQTLRGPHYHHVSGWKVV